MLVSSATTIVIGCPPVVVGARSRQCSKAVQHGCWRARRWQELTAGDPDVVVGDAIRRVESSAQFGYRVHDVGVEVAQHVIATPRELAGDRDRRDLAVVTFLDLRVVLWSGLR